MSKDYFEHNNYQALTSVTQSRFAVALFVSAILIAFVGGCNKKDAPILTSETSSTVVTTSTPTPTNSPTPTSTPTPTSSPTPTPSPTQIPEFIEPDYDTVWYNGFVDPYSVRAEIVTNPDDITVLVNKYYALPLDYVPSDLVTAPYSYDQQLRSECCEAWIQMHDDCLEAIGEAPFLVSGYRDPSLQQYLFDRSKNKNGYAFACQKNARPGRSEHQLGLAIDITTSYWTNIDDTFGWTTCGQWIDSHCYEYGFVLRFQDKYTQETGYGVEAWHYRYVGVELATYLYENDMTLEAYYGKVQILPGDE